MSAASRPGRARAGSPPRPRWPAPVTWGARSAGPRAALDAGAALVIDGCGGLADPELAPVVAAARVPFVAMHWRGPSDTMRRHAVYQIVVAEVAAELRVRLHALCDAGIALVLI